MHMLKRCRNQLLLQIDSLNIITQKAGKLSKKQKRDANELNRQRMTVGELISQNVYSVRKYKRRVMQTESGGGKRTEMDGWWTPMKPLLVLYSFQLSWNRCRTVVVKSTPQGYLCATLGRGCWRRQLLAIWVTTSSETSEIRPAILYNDILSLVVVGLWLIAKCRMT